MKRDNDIPFKRQPVRLHINVPPLLSDGSIPVQIPVTSPASSFKIGDVAGGNYTEFLQNGTIRYVGDARPWRDELGDALNIQRSGAGITLNLTENTVDFDYNAAYNANPSLADMLYKNVQLNHDKDLTASLYIHLHWLQAKNYKPNFLIQYRWQVNGGAKTTAWTFLKLNSLAFTYATGTINQISYAAPVAPPAGSTLSDILQVRIFRDTNNASGQFTGTCPYNTGGNASTGVLSFDIHFMTDGAGSDQELIK